MPHQQVRGPIRTALVGFGVAGSVFHAPLIAHNTDYRLDVIVTGDALRVASAKQCYPEASVLPDWPALGLTTVICAVVMLAGYSFFTNVKRLFADVV